MAQQARELGDRMETDVKAVVAANKKAQAERDEAAARADRYFKVIEDIERERNDWAERCRSAIVGHSAAQDLMMADNARLLRRLEAVAAEARKEQPDAAKLSRLATVRPDPTLEALAEQYKAEHGPVVEEADVTAKKAGEGQRRALSDDQDDAQKRAMDVT
ncbi:MAG: hypothetical protein GWN84_27155 [Gammaproteobacteria bacterium]|nr:hypothetical protein [Gammaproteobacteria bacterium]NIR86014.1 hypothetical protein [Gammaproteobacteria bacterium]NIU07255.1 hypothetical protein [Gammaproteobacteria bacterium]NIV54060.1 hypothetical protein [Gammaproteobacteria bacterium]NIX88528.1 hypothetical protein [Gammaproteobacteria bacterium]